MYGTKSRGQFEAFHTLGDVRSRGLKAAPITSDRARHRVHIHRIASILQQTESHGKYGRPCPAWRASVGLPSHSGKYEVEGRAVIGDGAPFSAQTAWPGGSRDGIQADAAEQIE